MHSEKSQALLLVGERCGRLAQTKYRESFFTKRAFSHKKTNSENSSVKLFPEKFKKAASFQRHRSDLFAVSGCILPAPESAV